MTDHRKRADDLADLATRSNVGHLRGIRYGLAAIAHAVLASQPESVALGSLIGNWPSSDADVKQLREAIREGAK